MNFQESQYHDGNFLKEYGNGEEPIDLELIFRGSQRKKGVFTALENLQVLLGLSDSFTTRTPRMMGWNEQW